MMMMIFIQMDLALNNLQWLIYHEITPNKQDMFGTAGEMTMNT